MCSNVNRKSQLSFLLKMVENLRSVSSPFNYCMFLFAASMLHENFT